MDMYYTWVLFIFGTLFGSFYNVVGYRLPKGESIVRPPSHCPNCNHRLTLIELIPIFSYLLQLGKCKNCKKKISLFYPIFELFSGILFALSYVVFGPTPELLIALIFVSMTLIIIISDIHYFIILDEILIIGVVLIGTLFYLTGGFSLLFDAILNGSIAFAIMFLIKKLGDFMFKKESMGGGDIKLLFVYGFVFGFEMAVLSIFIASFIGLPVSIAMLSMKHVKDHIIPFGPFLSLAALIILFFELNIDKVIELLY